MSTLNPGAILSDELSRQRATRADEAFERLQAAIVTGALPAGERISELALCERFDLTRGPLREALRRLESRGLVEKKAHVGVTVATLGPDQLLDLYRIREVMEGLAVRQAAQRMEDQELRDLRQLLTDHAGTIQAAGGQSYYQQEGDFDFHHRIVTGSRNQKLCQLLLGDLYHLVRMYRYRLSTFAGRPEKALQEHQHIVEALENRDGELAEFLMRRHISAARRNIENGLEDGSLTL